MDINNVPGRQYVNCITSDRAYLLHRATTGEVLAAMSAEGKTVHAIQAEDYSEVMLGRGSVYRVYPAESLLSIHDVASAACAARCSRLER